MNIRMRFCLCVQGIKLEKHQRKKQVHFSTVFLFPRDNHFSTNALKDFSIRTMSRVKGYNSEIKRNPSAHRTMLRK